MGCNTSTDATAGGGTFWYFAIGSMMNPRSVANRGLDVKESKPAELIDHKIYFFGSMGMAEAIAEKGQSFHGVLHRVDQATMAKLDKIENGYVRKNAKARLYDGTCVDCTVYARDNVERGKDIDKPPSQRYLEIMMAGAKHFGVNADYIKFLENHENVPRRQPHEFESFPVPEGLPEFTREQVDAADGKDGRDIM